MKYKNIENFNLIKLNVPNILKAIEAHISSKGSNTTSNATIDISQERDLMTNGVYSYPANALYDQICACLISDFNTPNDSFDADSLQNIVFHADFSGVKKLFTHDNTQETQNNKKNTLQHKALKHMLTNGFILKLSDVKSITLTPFDKSGSMSRTYRMTFIDSSFIEKLNKRLLLDMDFSKLDNVVRSKFYAYKGLYLSEGKRTINDKLLFDYSKVIVIKDYQYKVTEKQTISNSKTDNNTLEIKQSSEALDINSFDGEGIISPYYSDIINSVLEQTNASSYQIRMPFVKGVLHKVDFKKFILEELYEDNKNLQELYVEDLFGIKRNIFEAEIILTSSMLKNHSWIKNFLKNSNNDIDPMAFYFDAFNKYNHSLYVVKTNNSLPSQNYVPLNYQFLNTLDISSENFEKLINKHAERIISLKSDREELKKLLKASPDSKDPHLKALSYNDAFFDDSKITTILNSKFKSLTKDIATGRLSVRGIERFLSGDLMYFMLNIAKNINDNNENKPKSKQLENIKENTINSSEMFIPGSKNALDGKGYKYGNSKYTNTYYAILRNPHLSRHEQALLTLINENTYYKRNGKNTPYKSLLSKYFSDLTGIVMVSANSTIPLTIGGADFDGDEVKIIGEELVIKAIADGAYAENQEKGRLVRKLAVPYIKGGMAQPSHKSDPTATDDEYFETIINTFGNSVGQLSNAAIAIGEETYLNSASKDSASEINDNVKCTILTGLEIDAAKTGWHPTDEIETIIETGKQKRKIYKFLDNNIYSFSNAPISNVSVNDNTSKYYFKQYSYHKDFAVPKEYINPQYESDSLPNLERLSAYYAKYELTNKLSHFSAAQLLKDKKKKNKQADTHKKEKLIRFRFESENGVYSEGWKKALNKQTKSAIRCMMDARYTVIQAIKNYYAESNSVAMFNFKLIIKRQYADYDKKITEDLPKLRRLLDTYLKYSSEQDNNAYSALARFNDTTNEIPSWIYTSKANRFDKLLNIIAPNVSKDERDSLSNGENRELLNLLCNFEHDGYLLLYFIIRDYIERSNEYDIDAILYSSINTTENDSESESSTTENDDDTDEEYISVESSDIKYTDYMEKLTIEVKNMINNKQPISSIKRKIDDICKEDIFNLFINEETLPSKINMTEYDVLKYDWALKYIYSAPNQAKYRDFMWSVIPWCHMERNIFITNNPQEKNSNA